jgi:protease-4
MADENLRRRPHPLLVALSVIGAFALMAFVFVLLIMGWGFSQIASVGSGSGHSKFIGPIGADKIIAGIRLEGEIADATARSVLEKLQEAKENDQVVGILLDVNSPGGSVVASQEMYDAIKSLRDKKPVVAYVREMAASGAYYASASATKIVANRGSMVGSIGVIMSTVEATQLLNWLKVKPVTIKTGKLKDTGSPTREWTPEDVQYLQELINKTREQFVTDVREGRAVPEESLKKMSDGRVVLGSEALELKLVDALGPKDFALTEVRTLAKAAADTELIYLDEKPRFDEVLQRLLEEQSNSQVEFRKQMLNLLQSKSTMLLEAR